MTWSPMGPHWPGHSPTRETNESSPGVSPVPSECGLEPEDCDSPNPMVGFPRLQAREEVKIAGALVVYPFGTLQPLRFLAFVLLSVAYGAIWVGIGVAASALVATNRRALVLGVVALFVLVIVWDAVTAGAEAGLIAAGVAEGPVHTAVQVGAQLDPGSAFETLVTAFAVSDPGAGAWYDGPTLALPVFVGWLFGPLSVAMLRFEWRDLA